MSALLASGSSLMLQGNEGQEAGGWSGQAHVVYVHETVYITRDWCASQIFTFRGGIFY